jgi:hypothetical protein
MWCGGVGRSFVGIVERQEGWARERHDADVHDDGWRVARLPKKISPKILDRGGRKPKAESRLIVAVLGVNKVGVRSELPTGP